MLVEISEFDCKKNVTDEQIKENLHANFKRGLPTLKVKRAVVAGGGPSVADHIEEIRALQADGWAVFALNGAARFLLERGIAPDWHVLYDARPENTTFITGEPPRQGYIVASHMHPAVLDALAGRNVTLFHSLANKHMLEDVKALDTNAHVLGGGITVGLQMLNILVVMGYRTAKLYGYDSSNRGEAHHAYPQPINDGRKTLKCHFRGKDYEADPVMAAQAREFQIVAPVIEKLGLKIDVIGEGLLPDMWRAHKEKPRATTLEAHEAQKYAAMWNIPAYRKWAPGEDLVETFIQACDVGAGSRIIDFGCGTGRAAKRLSERGYDVLGVDHAANCLDAGVRIPLCIANLWQLPELAPADWGYCTDVMEHIPPEKVADVLAGIAANVRTGAFFQISFVPDNFGAAIGEPLHLTVKDANWWADQLGGHFRTVECLDSTQAAGVFICKH